MKTCIQRDKKRQWCAQLYPNFSSKKWKKISQIFKQKGYDRSELEIRERWTNFQDPSLLFTQWTDDELQTLYKSYTKFGSKWCFIKRTIPGRQLSYLSQELRTRQRTNSTVTQGYFCDSWSTTSTTPRRTRCGYTKSTRRFQTIFTRGLNVSGLVNQEFTAFGNQMELAIQEMGYNVDKIKLLSRIQIQQEKYRDFYEKVIELYKSIEGKKEKSVRKGKKQRTEMSSVNFGSAVDLEDDQQNESQSEGQQKVNRSVPKYEMPGMSFPFGNEPLSMMSQFDLHPQSMTFTRPPTFESSNFPLMQFQGMHSYYSSWYYQN